jgi:hypothetical protein
MIKQIFLTSVLVLAAALFMAGCGGGDDKASTLTKAEFLKQGDAICKKADKAQETEFAVYAKAHSKNLETKTGREKLILVAGLRPVLAEAEELAALGVPSGDEKEVEAIVTGIKEAVKKAEKNPQSVEALSKNPFEEVDELSREYGFKICAEAL